MADEEWRVSDLLDDEHPLVADVSIARQIVETLASVERVDDLDVRVPKAAIEFAQNTLSEWFEIIAGIEKKRGNLPYLADRSLYSADAYGDVLEWNQGIKLQDFETWAADQDFMELFDQNFPLIKPNPVATSDTPFSGYYNRILPVKFVLRILAVLAFSETHESDGDGMADGISLKHLRSTALDTASYAREWLVSLDQQSGSTKGSEIAVGFPERSEKAQERFIAQFVGSKRKKLVSGALFEMGFVNLSSLFGIISFDDIRFTPAGWKFAMLSNPIIDGGFEEWKQYADNGKRFSDDEISFLLDHFESNTPAEWGFLTRIAVLIDEGHNRPKLLEKQLIKSYDWEKTKASQMRNGALSRMEELSLIEREKKGREVTYSLTDLCIERVLGEE